MPIYAGAWATDWATGAPCHARNARTTSGCRHHPAGRLPSAGTDCKLARERARWARRNAQRGVVVLDPPPAGRKRWAGGVYRDAPSASELDREIAAFLDGRGA